VEIVQGTLEERLFVAQLRRAHRFVGVLGVNRPRHVVQMRMKMESPLGWDDAVAHFGE
jgi:hypothetical protein